MYAAEKEKLLKDYIPKDASQQKDFLSKYPEFDGRGLKIVIMDSGVNLSFEGMQKTTTGLPKVLDCFDFTGAGLVDTSVVKKTDANNTIIGLSGRLLKIPSNWKNPSGQWHLGIKSIYEMCRGPALESIINKRKEYISLQNEILRENTITKMKQINRQNYNSMISYLKMTEKLSKDSLVADCIVWFDGEKWQACIDTSFIGDLEKVKVLTNYNDEHEYDKVWDTVSYCIKTHDNGNSLDIISAYDDHGTYVAHVAAACFPGEPERNGLAPGAQIISMTVMDSRKGNYLSYSALKKALEKCVDLRADIINCSFSFSDDSYKNEIKKMAEEHEIIITKSAGNKGPAYSSLNYKSFIHKGIFFIGSIEMKKELEQITYKIADYSSKGPNLFGGRGVCFSAPGDATIALPEYYPETISSVVGTSFAAPNVAGSIACLISALKANSIKYSPSTIKFALSKTAFLPPNGDVLAYGHGIIQISTAFEFLQSPDFLKQYESGNCRVKLLNQEKNGIFLKIRESEKVADKSYSIEILNKVKRDEIALQITPEAEKFVQYSDLKDDTFTVNIDPTKLKPGTINYAEIFGINLKNSLTDNIFHLPITVLVPQKIAKEDNCRLHELVIVEPQIPYRFFILPPEKSSQCIVKITLLDKCSTYLALQCATEDVCVSSEKIIKWLQFDRTNKTQTHFFEVNWYKIHEISLSSPPWMTKSVKFDVEIDFYGIYSTKQIPKIEHNIKMENNNVLTFVNHLRVFTASLSIEFEKISYDLIPENISYEKVKNVFDSDLTESLKLSYAFTISKETKCLFKMNHRRKCPLQSVHIFTESKKVINGIFLTGKKPVTLLAGKYSIIAYVAYPLSSKNNVLPKETILPSITVTMELYQPFTPPIYSNQSTSRESKYPTKKFYEFKNGEHQIYFENMPAENLPHPLPKNAIFHGSIIFKIKNTVLNVPFEQKCIYRNEYVKSDVLKNSEKENAEYNIHKNLLLSYKKTIKSTKSKNLKKIKIKNEAEEIVPLKFKENFKSELTNFCCTKEYCNSSINEITEKLGQTKISEATKAQEYAIKVCDIFLENVENESILKEMAQIKQALISGHFGMALLVLNKISTKHQTNPAFKVIDLAIIELLKHLKWDHLVEAHRHALLDRHRDYYRLL